MRDARALALEVLTKSDAKRIPSDPLLAPRLAQSRLDARDRRLATTLIKTTHRWRGRADYILDGRLTRGVRSVDCRTLNILRLGYIQLFHLSQIPPHAIIHSAVELAMRSTGPGKARLVNSVLRGLLSRPPTPRDWNHSESYTALAGELSHPAWLLERWMARWGRDEVRRVCAWNNEPPRLHMRLTGDAATRAATLGRLDAEQIPYGPGAVTDETIRCEGLFPVHDHVLMSQGRLVPQDESQTLVARLMPAAAEGPILDLCAAPGTKASHLAERFPHQPVLAADVSLRKARRLRETRTRLGFHNIHVLAADGTRPPWGCLFGALLLDAPCTGLGVLQRRPDARWLRSPGEILDAVRRQRALMESAAGLVLPGGYLLYSVCSVEPEESDENVAWFLEAQPDFEPVPLPDWLPEPLRASPGRMRILPGMLGMEGCFAALLRRRR
jgi:16S rRNA (cytosine967-C5)-methyltransferase